ncbi:MAG TPA: low molecular weight protein-tyrosine-phosphatase [Rhodocyclaceae bacterium]|nr:low molecular weight protein-tyrosine-phosphatase [Rhodocyclaceae bacterium]
MKRILFVCTGNICRSPTADGVARFWAAKTGMDGELHFDSAGTQAYHEGEAPDPRAQRVAAQRGYDLSRLRARRIAARDFEIFDLILAMDRGHLRELQRDCPREHHHKLAMFLSFAERFPAGDVPDPYYGGEHGFEQVLDMCEDAVQGIIDHLR